MLLASAPSSVPQSKPIVNNGNQWHKLYPPVNPTSDVAQPPAPRSSERQDDRSSRLGPSQYGSQNLPLHPQRLNKEAGIVMKQKKIETILNNKLMTIPLRLIDTVTGKLCSIWELRACFKDSPGYKNITQRIYNFLESEVERTIDQFFHYAMFSHRWSTNCDDEPTYQHVKGIASIYYLRSPPGVLKLQNFCKAARENDLRWAWSDTCCIDKSNNVEYQQSIISMFSWYRSSTVTIVYLADVMDEESFRQSEWFTRGWTLQELIAPRIIWFYRKDWMLCFSSRNNHKGEDQVADLISEITSIDPMVLNHFEPGLREVGPGEVKKRMGWLAKRTTTEIEDMAYCMMGIFGVHMPIMYGEKNYAFARLQKEIMNITDDVSLFDWVGEPSELHSYFASQPSCFTKVVTDYKNKMPGLELRPLETLKGMSDALQDSVMQTAKNILLDPPHGYFIANGRMNMRLFVHEVNALTPVETTDSNILAIGDDGLFTYKITAQDLAEITITTRNPLPLLTSDKNSPSYRLVRMWEINLIPRGKDGEGEGEGEGEDKGVVDEEHYEAIGIKGLERPLSVVGTVMDAISLSSVFEFLGRLQEPFIAQLLRQKKPGMPYERVGTEERLVAQPYSGSFNLRGMKTVIVR